MFVLQQKVLSLLLVMSFAAAQERYEARYHAQVDQHSKHLTDIPKGFTIKGNTAVNEFQKYAEDIHRLAAHENMNVIYKVKVETVKKINNQPSKKVLIKGKSKKYKVPLKKANMKLSNFEIVLRKLAEENDKLTSTDYENLLTTKSQKRYLTTKQWTAVGKYKPIIGRVKLHNYTRIIRPVRNREIILTK